MAGYLRRQADAHAAGLAPVETTGEVVPFEAAPVQTVEPRVAWDEATAAIRFFAGKQAPRSLAATPDWPLLVASQEPGTALAFAVGNYPQLVRHVRPLMTATDLTALRPTTGRPVTVNALASWAEAQTEFPQLLLAIGALRLARQFETAETLLAKHRAAVPEAYQAAWANEEAALMWHRGQADKAAALWAQQPDSVPVFFNRGMAALFLGRPADARTWLTRARTELPETSAWHHLACLYLALAEMRG
jgi:hypothetical protein